MERDIEISKLDSELKRKNKILQDDMEQFERKWEKLRREIRPRVILRRYPFIAPICALVAGFTFGCSL